MCFSGFEIKICELNKWVLSIWCLVSKYKLHDYFTRLILFHYLNKHACVTKERFYVRATSDTFRILSYDCQDYE